MNQNGKVYLIGAGPGDPGLITVKGLKALQEADVILYDRLAPPELLAEAKPGAELIDVGKRRDSHTMTQAMINDAILDHARQGKVVARLKGGDPFVFGRGGEEAEACKLANIPFIIIPGITSAIAVPAYAGIPVTHRDFTSAFAVITGHEHPAETTALDYTALAKIGTLVFLMAARHLSDITAALIAAGRDGSTPAACIQDGTTPRQKVVTGTLTTIADIAAQAELKAPLIIVIGEVASLHAALDWNQ
jgi:uroporphyrin-III C-methyltransferase